MTEERSLTLAKRRKRLKQKLFRNRALTSAMRPNCPICGNRINARDGGQMHEVFLTRGDAQKLPEQVRFAIYAPENCVILCSEACHVQAATKQGKVLCARQILLFEGYHQIEQWLRRAKMNWKGDQPEIEHRYLWNLLFAQLQSPIYNPDTTTPETTIRPGWKAENFT